MGIQQQRFAIRNDARRSGIRAEQELVLQPLMKRLRFGPVTARKDGYITAGIAQGAGEFLHHGRLARAAHGDVADGDHLHAERVITEDADVIKPTAGFDGKFEELGTAK